MTTSALCAIAAVVLIATSRIPKGLLVLLVAVWLLAYSHAAPGELTHMFDQAHAWAAAYQAQH